MGLFTKDRAFYKSFFLMMLTIALQNLIVFSVNLVDNIMLGQYAETALSGAALANQIQFLLQMTVNGVGDGLSVLTAQYWGQKDIMPIRRLVGVAVRYGFVLSLLFMAVAFIFPVQCLSLMSNDMDIVAAGAEYLRIMGFTYFFFCMTTILISVLRSIEKPKIGVYTSIAALVTNVFLNYGLIFGNMGFPRLGVRGAAIATMIARIVEFIIVFVYVLKVDKRLAMKFKDFFVKSKALAKDFKRVAMPVILSGASWGIAMAVQVGILGHMGGNTIGANSIANTLFQVITVISFGSSSAAAVLTGKIVGSGDLTRLKEYTRTMQCLFIGIGLCCSALLLVFQDPIIALYGSEISPETQSLAREFITILSITVIGTAYQVSCLTGIVRGGGNTKFVLYNDLIFMWGLVLPSALLCAFVFNLSPAIVFFCLKSDQLLKCIVAAWAVNRYRWVKKVTR